MNAPVEHGPDRGDEPGVDQGTRRALELLETLLKPLIEFHDLEVKGRQSFPAT